MTFLTREFGLRSERVVDELMNDLYLAFELGRTAKTSRAPRMFRLGDTLSPTSPTTHFSTLLHCQLFRRHINQSETLFWTYICEF